MHGKSQLEPTQHSVVVDCNCKLMPLHKHMPKFACCLLSPLQRCLVRVQSRAQKSVFCPQSVGINVRGSSDQIFRIAVISEYASEFD